MRRRHLAALALTVPFGGCYQPGSFELKWDEEVLLADGRVVTVGIAHTFLRTERSWTEFGGLGGVIKTTMTVDAGPEAGVVTQDFVGFRPILVGIKNGTWHAILFGSYRASNSSVPGQNWGDQAGPDAQWPIRLVGGRWQAMPFNDFPDEFQQPNMILLYGSPEEMSAFHRRRVTLPEKAAWLKKHPPGPGHLRVRKPSTN